MSSRDGRGRTLLDKLWQRHAIAEAAGHTLLYIDRHLLHEGSMSAFPEDADPETASPTVAAIRPDGPAATSDLQVGDTIVSVDGNDVRDDSMSYQTLTMVPPGTTVTLGLARGASIRIRAAESR